MTPGSPLTALKAPALAGIRRLNALDTVRARIAMAVDLGLLKPGERLPPTDEIARALGVGEITARRALVSLCAEGVLERRRGRNGGTLVAHRPVTGGVIEIEAYRSAADEVHRLIDQRLLLECGIAHLAASNVSRRQLEELEELVAQMDRVSSWAEFHTCDERFHTAIAAATGLPSAGDQYGPILRELYRYYLPYPLDYLRESNGEHAELVAALTGRDPLKAVDVTRRHVETLHRTMFVGLIGRQPSADVPPPAVPSPDEAVSVPASAECR
ncbi:FadR/GntR family transcriptional regulator [Streptosporangium lutulentum]|uniref:DNA-binding FadR family transcriptional regulator n=1 Tax=Streptosporangium lutulentum TaxID=1461250 RepID=A0ABT9Q6I7_9ACTN|nr:GntR family transcriptional regulator [Streptosporangium lutulentum]MDP9842380.1 DNA-binding FadR family transcriptional regulator [Streptosporangium lutulentum]